MWSKGLLWCHYLKYNVKKMKLLGQNNVDEQEVFFMELKKQTFENVN